MSRKPAAPKLQEIAPPPWQQEMAVGRLRRTRPTALDLSPDADEREAIANYLGLVALKSLRLRGEIIAHGREGWRLQARLTAELSQPCVASLDPVPQKIDERIVRDFLPADTAPPGEAVDIELDSEDEPDFFEDSIDPGHVAIECLALALEPYPRVPDTEPIEARATPPGAEEIDDEAEKPFAALVALRDKLQEG